MKVGGVAWRLVWGDICVRQRLKILLKVWSLLEDFDGGAKTLPKDRSTAQPWLSHRLKFAAGKRASHHIASHDASPTLSGFYRLFLFRMKKLNKKTEFFRAALFACRVTNHTKPKTKTNRAWTLGTSQKNISWQYYTQLTWHWFNTNENNNNRPSKGLGPIEANLHKWGTHSQANTHIGFNCNSW